MAEHLAQTLMGNTPAFPHENLSARELDVFVQIVSGETTAAIAHALSGVARPSVRTEPTYSRRRSFPIRRLWCATPYCTDS